MRSLLITRFFYSVSSSWEIWFRQKNSQSNNDCVKNDEYSFLWVSLLRSIFPCSTLCLATQYSNFIWKQLIQNYFLCLSVYQN